MTTPNNKALSEGVKPGGLTTITEIKILLCYMLKSFDFPLTQDEITNSLLSANLVNYFEIGNALSELIDLKYVTESEKGFSITNKGLDMVTFLINDLPLTVKETALNSILYLKQITIKQNYNIANISKMGNEFLLQCKIIEMNKTIFSFELILPDEESAKYAKEKFVETGEDIYLLLLAGLTKNKFLALDYFTED